MGNPSSTRAFFHTPVNPHENLSCRTNRNNLFCVYVLDSRHLDPVGHFVKRCELVGPFKLG